MFHLLGMVFTIQTPLFAVTLRFLPWDDAVAARKIGFLNGKGVTELQDLHPHKRSKPFAVIAPEIPLQLVALDRSQPDGKPVALEIKVTPELVSPLVLILADATHPTGFRIFIIEDDTSKFPWGTIRFLNASGTALLVREEETVTALPASSDPVDVAPGGKARNIGVQLVARDNLKDILYSAVWEHDPDVRKLAFIVPGAELGTGAVNFKIIPENRRALAREQAGRP